MAIFNNTNGNQTFNGVPGEYNQVDYRGSLSDFRIYRNDNGTVTVEHPTLGTDILNRIDGFWFGGDNSWFSIDDAIAQTPGRGGAVTAPTPFINAWGVLEGTDGNDTLFDTFATNGLYGGEGNDFLFGSLLNYSQAEYDGSADDYTFTQNANGSVRVTSAQYGVDTLNNIDGIWFRGEARWSSVEDLIETTGGNDTGGNGGGTGTVIGGVITGRNDVNDRLEGTNANDTFYAGRGDDAINGGGGRDTLRVDGDITEWTFDLQNNGTLIMTHPTWGENIVTGVEQLFSIRAGRNYTIDQALQLTDRLPEFRLDADNVLNGTNGNDNMVGANAGTNFYGGLGDDVFIGSGRNYDQINYDGDRSEYTFTQNANGSITSDHPIWGTDTLTNIDGIFFNGTGTGGEWIAPDDLFIV